MGALDSEVLKEIIDLLTDPDIDPICDCGEPGYACECEDDYDT